MSTSKLEGLRIERNQVFTDDELIAYAQTLSTKSGDLREQLLHWDFGPLMHMQYKSDAVNYLFSAEKVPFHWDGAFYREPLFLLFYCSETDGEGGETVFCNTNMVWNSLSQKEKNECENIKLVYRTEKKAHYGGEIRVDLVQKHPLSGSTILRLAERVDTTLNPVSVEILGVSDPQGFYETMVAKLHDPQFTYVHRWEKGDLLVCDNFTYLHGRRPLENNLSRAFKRIQIL